MVPSRQAAIDAVDEAVEQLYDQHTVVDLIEALQIKLASLRHDLAMDDALTGGSHGYERRNTVPGTH